MQRLRLLFMIIIVFICWRYSDLYGEGFDYRQDMLFIMLDGEEIQLTGYQLKALLAAVNDFEMYNLSLEKYTISIMEIENIIGISFSPKRILPSNVYGNPENEKSIVYYISKDNFEIVEKVWSR